MTFSIVAADVRTGALGVAAGASGDLRSRCLVAGAPRGGMVAIQGASPVGPDPTVLASLAAGADPRDALAALLGRDAEKDQRQVMLVDARGRTAAHSGRGGRRLFAHTEGTDHVAGGDDLPSANVVGAMSLSFERSGSDPLWERLLLALESGARAGGDNNGTRAAMLVVYGDAESPPIELLVEDDEDPIGELRRLLSARVAF